MNSFIAFLKKELLESSRSGKLLLIVILFCIFGIMNPAIAKLTPWLIETMSEELAESGMTVTEVTVNALTSWTQFFKNIPMALIAFILIYGSIFTKEYDSGTLILVLTKGLSRYKVVWAKAFLMLSFWTIGYWCCFAITYAYNSYYWDNSIALNLIPAVINWWLFGIFTVALTVLFSVISKTYGNVLLGTGATVLVLYLIGLFPKISPLSPSLLLDHQSLISGIKEISHYMKSVIITAIASVLCVGLSIPLFNKKQL